MLFFVHLLTSLDVTNLWVWFNTGEDGVVNAGLLQGINGLNNGAIFDLFQAFLGNDQWLVHMQHLGTVTDLGDNARAKEVNAWH